MAELLKLSDIPDRTPGFDFDGEFWTLHWGNYPYEIDRRDMREPKDLLRWIDHLCEKTWRGMTPIRIRMLINSVCQAQGWSLHGDQ